ncbi:MAG: AAA family ATPase [Planctomycetota bacterium]
MSAAPRSCNTSPAQCTRRSAGRRDQPRHAAHQSALLEAMEERRTVFGETRKLPEPFMVVATQNPIEMEGTFPLPEAQLDRFLIKLDLPLPTPEQLQQLLLHPAHTGASNDEAPCALHRAEVLRLQSLVKQIAVGERRSVGRAHRACLHPTSPLAGAKVRALVRHGSSPAADLPCSRWPAPAPCSPARCTCAARTSRTSPPPACSTASCLTSKGRPMRTACPRSSTSCAHNRLSLLGLPGNSPGQPLKSERPIQADAGPEVGRVDRYRVQRSIVGKDVREGDEADGGGVLVELLRTAGLGGQVGTKPVLSSP